MTALMKKAEKRMEKQNTREHSAVERKLRKTKEVWRGIRLYLSSLSPIMVLPGVVEAFCFPLFNYLFLNLFIDFVIYTSVIEPGNFQIMELSRSLLVLIKSHPDFWEKTLEENEEKICYVTEDDCWAAADIPILLK